MPGPGRMQEKPDLVEPSPNCRHSTTSSEGSDSSYGTCTRKEKLTRSLTDLDIASPVSRIVVS